MVVDVSGPILCVNAGSSTLKLATFAVRDGAIEAIVLRTFGAAASIEDAVASVLGGRAPAMIGHRVVHGGSRYVAPVRIDARVTAELRSLVALAPLHMPPALAAIDALTKRFPSVPQAACFDTAFHATLPEIARRLPIPERFDRAGVRRFGFHGLSYEYVMFVLGADAPRRIVMAHLGAGSSLVAVRDRKAIDTTMGFTPAGGVAMATRTGDIDPGALVYMMRREKMTIDDVERIVDRESGLAGIAGTGDVKTLLERRDGAARLALGIYCHGVRKAIAAMTAALSGIDLLVFTGGIGENAPFVRAEACRGLEAFGIVVDARRNDSGNDIVSADESRAVVRVVATNEDAMIALHTRRVLAGA